VSMPDEPRWMHAPDVPQELEGRQAWKWLDTPREQPPCVDVIPRGYSRDMHHCGGVWFCLLDPPETPRHIKARAALAAMVEGGDQIAPTSPE
jgi:hypothetical protein